MSVLPIHWSQLALCMAFVVVAAGASLVLRLGLERDLLWGSVRTFAQLFLVGYVLHFIFDLRNPALVLLYYVWMIFWAARAVRKRVNEDRVRVFGPTFVSMVVSYILVTAFVTGAIVTETVFAWPGIGSFAVEALVVSDYAAVQGFVLSMALLFVTLNLLIDVIYTLIDPRVGEEA